MNLRVAGAAFPAIRAVAISRGVIGVTRLQRPPKQRPALSQRSQARESRLAREMARRDDLYKEFIAAASKAYGEAIVINEPNVQEFVALYALISMRLQSPPQTVACAEKIMRATIDTYFASGKTIRELHELAQSGSGIDLLKDFGEVAREEVRALTMS
jgi:hypothetical protein